MAASPRSAGKPEHFSLVAMVNAVLAGTWQTTRSVEKDCVDRLDLIYGASELNAQRIPDVVLLTRDLKAAVGSSGGYFVETGVGSYIDTLRPASVAFALGAQSAAIGKGGEIIVRGAGGITTKWLSDEVDSADESSALFASVASQPKMLIALCEISRKALLQSDAENVLRREMRNAAAAAVDAAVLAGTGTFGQPLGIVNTPGVNAVSGTSLGFAGIIEAQQDVATANGAVNRNALGWTAPPAIAALLKAEMKVADTFSPIWEGDINDGAIDSKPALSTTGCPDATAIYADWSGVTLNGYAGGLQIGLDPFTKFTQGIVGVRLMLPVDVVLTRPASFSVISSIT